MNVGQSYVTHGESGRAFREICYLNIMSHCFCRSLSSADTKMGEGGSEVPHGSAVVSDNNNSKAVNSVDEEVLKLQGALAMMQVNFIKAYK